MERSERYFLPPPSVSSDPGNRPLARSREAPDQAVSGWGGLQDETSLRLSSSMSLAVDARDSEIGIVAHSVRVARMVRRFAELLKLRVGERRVLDHAAQLHEIGMVAVPLELLTRAGPLTPGELEQVHRQAAIGAEIVRATHEPRTAGLVARQYSDYSALASDAAVPADDVLLAGVLRVADALDAFAFPRPYQEVVQTAERVRVLRSGIGTTFHPLAAYAALRHPAEFISAENPAPA